MSSRSRSRRAPLALAAVASAAISMALHDRASGSFVFAPIQEPILSATFIVDTAGLTAHRTLLGHEVNMLRLFDPSHPNSVFDASDQMFGSASWPGSPLVDQGAFGTGWLAATIDPSFFSTLASGTIGLSGVLTDTGDGIFAIDTIMLQIVTANGSYNATYGASYGSANDGFGLGLADGASLPDALATLLPPDSTGTGFDEAISSKAFGTPAPGALSLLAVAAMATRSRRRHSASTVARGAMACAAAAALVTGTAEGQGPQIHLNGTREANTHVPVVINIYNNANVTAAEAESAIREANRVLRRARCGMELHVVRPPTMNATAGDANGDGDVHSPNAGANEVNAVHRAGLGEVRALPGGRGLKISFVHSITAEDENGLTVSAAGIASPGTPSAIVTKATEEDGTYNAEATGVIIAHEIAHIHGLGSGHRVEPATPGNPGVADGGGHVPPESHPNNLVNPVVTESNTTLTTAQSATVRRHRLETGRCAAQFDKDFPEGRVPHQTGTRAPSGGAPAADGPGFATLEDLTAIAVDGEAELYGTIRLAGIFAGAVDVHYAWAFNSDGNVATGVPYMGFAGIEHAIELTVGGAGEPYAITGLVRHLADGSVTPMDDVAIEPVISIPCMTGSDFTQTVASSIRFMVPKESLGLPVSLVPDSPSVVPIGIATSTPGGVASTETMDLHLRAWLEDPLLTTFGNGVPTPGAGYPIAVCGLTPLAPFSVLFDDEVIMTGTLDADGGFDGDIPIPADASAAESHFLAVQDEEGNFAGGGTCPREGDQVHVAGPALSASLDSIPSFVATLESQFEPSVGLPVIFTRLVGAVEFGRGERTEDGSATTQLTDEAGKAPMQVVPTGLGPVLISVASPDLPTPAYVFFEVVAAPAAPGADLNGDGHVDAGDVAILLGAWGSPATADLDGDGTVGPGDLGIVLGAWTG